jgi:chromosome segregation ATPase
MGCSKSIRVMTGALMALTLVTATTANARIICWTDDNGRKACGDVAPPEVMARERQVMNSRGMVVEVHARAPTEAERQAQAEATLRAAEEAALAERSAAYDRFLLETYRNLDELVSQGERRLEAVAGRKALAEQTVADAEMAVAGLRERKARLESDGRPIPAKLIEQLQTFESDLAGHQAALEGLTEQQNSLHARYAADAERFAALKASQP